MRKRELADKTPVPDATFTAKMEDFERLKILQKYFLPP